MSPVDTTVSDKEPGGRLRLETILPVGGKVGTQTQAIDARMCLLKQHHVSAL